jgi:hypothetical protein
MQWHRALGATLTALALLLVASAVAAQPLVAPPQKDALSSKPEKPRLQFQVTVLHASPEAGGIGAGAERFDRLLRDTVRYNSLRVMKSKRRRVALNEIERVPLPTGQDFRFRPIDASDRGVLVSVDWRKTARGDFRMPRGKPLILGGQPYENGQLVVILEAD